MRRWLAAVYDAALELLPRDFRAMYCDEIRAVHRTRLETAGSIEAIGLEIVECADVVLTAMRLRGRPNIGRRQAFVGALSLALLLVIVSGHAPNLQPGFGEVAGADSIDFHGSDPAGVFSLSIRNGRAVAATLDDVPLPSGRLVSSGDSIRFLAPDGAVVLSVAYYPAVARIEWEARDRSCRGRALACAR